MLRKHLIRFATLYFSFFSVKPALQAIQKRYHHENPHVSHHALLVLEACVKNCGKRVC